MDLFLLRHADANTEATSDDARRLSEKGLAQAQKLARFCEAHELAPDLILSSPIRRAHETANAISQHLRKELITVPWLACGMRPEVALDELRAYQQFSRLMIVGHEPDFSSFAAFLLGLPTEQNIRIRKGSLTHLDLPMFRAGTASLQFSIPSRLM